MELYMFWESHLRETSLGNTNGGCIVCKVIYIFHCCVILIISFLKYFILWGHFCGMIGINQLKYKCV